MRVAQCPGCKQDSVPVTNDRNMAGVHRFDPHKVNMSDRTSPWCENARQIVPGTEPKEKSVPVGTHYSWQPGLNAEFNIG